MKRFELRNWVAGMREWRIALWVSILCMAAITVAVLRPDLITPSGQTMPAERQAQYRIPSRPAQTPSSDASLPAKTTPQSHATVHPAKEKTPPAPRSQPASTKTAASPTGPHPAAALADGYYVQLGTFRKRALADRLANRFQSTRMHIHRVDKHGMHAVWVGPWQTHEQAAAARKSIHDRTGLNGFITHP